MEIEIPRGRRDREALETFADILKILQRDRGFKISARGWCYDLEPHGLFKGDFDRLESLINWMRKDGLLPLDFTALDPGRRWDGLEIPTSESPVEWMAGFLKAAKYAGETYTPDWWKDERYYIQMLVEKIDLKTLFSPVCRKYHIPISTAGGWSDINQRAEMAFRFKYAEEDEKTVVLLYAGDFDPFGRIIRRKLRKNLGDLSKATGWDPADLVVDRFALKLDFIEDNDLSWIENLQTGSGRDLADPSHRSHDHPVVQEWIRTIGIRKVEANAIIRQPAAARDLCRDAIERYLGRNALRRFQGRRDKIKREIRDVDEETGVFEAIDDVLRLIEGEE